LAVTWIIIVLLCFGWFVLLAALEQDNYRPSFLLLLCLFAAFKTMRLVDDLAEEPLMQTAEADSEAVASVEQAEVSDAVCVQDTSTNKALSPELVHSSASVSRPLSETVVLSPNQDDSSEVNHPPRKIDGVSLKTVLACSASAGCLLALFDFPDEFFKVLRFVVVAACVAVIWDVQKSTGSANKKTAISIAFGLLAVIFNPILPLEMERETWAWFNVIGGILFLAALGEVFFKKFAKVAIVGFLVLGSGWGAWLLISTKIQAEKWETALLLPKPDSVISGQEAQRLLDELPQEKDMEDRKRAMSLLNEYRDYLERSEIFKEIEHWRLIFRSAEYRSYLIGDALKDNIFPTTAAYVGANGMFLQWALGRDISPDEMPNLIEEWFGGLHTQEALFKTIKDEFDDCQDGTITLGTMKIDLAARLAYSDKNPPPDADEARRAKASAISVLRE